VGMPRIAYGVRTPCIGRDDDYHAACEDGWLTDLHRGIQRWALLVPVDIKTQVRIVDDHRTPTI
jgi:hypothetical protein